ncbi:uncharacterized protein [Cebidichthys violaceus]
MAMPWSADQLLTEFNFLQDIRQTSLDHLSLMSELVSTFKHKTIVLESPAGATWTVGDLEDTIYSGKENVVNGWNKFYLPDIVDMQVIGVVEGTSCPCDQLVLMTCEDKKLYAYDGDELHLVASSLMQLLHQGIAYPAATSYYKGEAFKKMTNKDWDEVRKGAVGKRLDQDHHKLVMSKKSKFLENLRSIRPKTGACS